MALASWLIAVSPIMARADAFARVRTTVGYRCPANSSTPLVSVTLNDKTAATFTLDTGFQISVISVTLAKKMGLSPEPAVTPTGQPVMVAGKPLYAVTVDSLSLGAGKPKISFTTCPLAVFTDKSIKGVSDKDVDGIIGTDLLRLMAVELDCPHHQVTFWYPGNLSQQELTGKGFDHPLAVPVTDPDQMELYYVQGQLQNGAVTASEKMIIDTGLNATTILASVAKMLGLVPDTTGTAALFASVVSVYRARVPSIRFGDLVLHDYPIFYYEKDNLQNAISLGMGVLSGYRVLLDYAHGTVYLKSTVPDKINILGK